MAAYRRVNNLSYLRAPVHRDQLRAPTLANEYGKPLYLFFIPIQKLHNTFDMNVDAPASTWMPSPRPAVTLTFNLWTPELNEYSL